MTPRSGMSQRNWSGWKKRNDEVESGVTLRCCSVSANLSLRVDLVLDPAKNLRDRFQEVAVRLLVPPQEDVLDGDLRRPPSFPASAPVLAEMRFADRPDVFGFPVRLPQPQEMPDLLLKDFRAPVALDLIQYFSVRGATVHPDVAAARSLGTAVDLLGRVAVAPRIHRIVAVQFRKLIMKSRHEMIRKLGGHRGIRQRLRTEGEGGKSAALAQVADDGKDEQGVFSSSRFTDRILKTVVPPETGGAGRRASESRRQREQERYPQTNFSNWDSSLTCSRYARRSATSTVWEY